MITAVVPVKALAASKSRLFPDRARADVEALSLAMMGDVIECLLDVDALDRVVIATPDVAVAAAARGDGAEVLLRQDPGLNAAIDAAASETTGPGDRLLVVLGDVAAAASGEVAQLLEAVDRRGVALAPSSDGGTSALLRVPGDIVPACFGPDSAKRHREAAERAGAPYREIALPSLAIDVDVREDVDAILRCPTLGRRTRSLLEAFEGVD